MLLRLLSTRRDLSRLVSLTWLGFLCMIIPLGCGACGMTVPLWRAFTTLKLLLDMSSPIVEAARLNAARGHRIPR